MEEYLIKPRNLTNHNLRKIIDQRKPTKNAEDLFPSTFHYPSKTYLKPKSFMNLS